MRCIINSSFEQIHQYSEDKIMTITIPAYAKINLFLDIVSLREDKYHNILSLMQKVDLHDLITVDVTDSDQKSIEVSCDNSALPLGSDNLVYKAADLFPIQKKIKVSIQKNIPISAGLAGGSTDAAATLVALNQLTGSKLSVDELKTLGKKLGADVPFCIDGKASIVEGIGDVMTPCASMPCLPMVIARMGEGMSTPAAYRLLDEKYNCFKEYTPKRELLLHLTGENRQLDAKSYCKGLYNIFESVVEPLRSEVSHVKEIMTLCGAAGCMMSGSGTAVFGIFENESEAELAVKKLRATGAYAHLCYPI